jgi:predicted GNAT superfamily acetyltransferase
LDINKILSIKQSFSKEFLEDIYCLNQENTPEVGSLPSAQSLQELIKISSNAFYFSKNDELIGFIICFRENSVYGSENYKFFNKNKKKFIYIDRIVVKDGYRRMGFGTKFYKYLDKVASEKLLPICCEVNSIPKNEISMNFHINNGFKEVGKRDYQNHSVKYFEKNIKKNLFL